MSDFSFERQTDRHTVQSSTHGAGEVLSKCSTQMTRMRLQRPMNTSAQNDRGKSTAVCATGERHTNYPMYLLLIPIWSGGPY